MEPIAFEKLVSLRSIVNKMGVTINGEMWRSDMLEMQEDLLTLDIIVKGPYADRLESFNPWDLKWEELESIAQEISTKFNREVYSVKSGIAYLYMERELRRLFGYGKVQAYKMDSATGKLSKIECESWFGHNFKFCFISGKLTYKLPGVMKMVSPVLVDTEQFLKCLEDKRKSICDKDLYSTKDMDMQQKIIEELKISNECQPTIGTIVYKIQQIDNTFSRRRATAVAASVRKEEVRKGGNSKFKNLTKAK